MNRLKRTDIVGLGGNHPALQSHHLYGVQSDLNDVVDQGQQGSQWERCHEDGGEAELDHCKIRTGLLSNMTWITVKQELDYCRINTILLQYNVIPSIL